MPPQLASQFTTGELAVLRLVADEVRAKRHCTLTMGEFAARAGVGITTARNALHEAAGHGYLTIEERRRDKRPNLANVVRVVSREWLGWIERGRRNPSAGRENANAFAAQGEGPKKRSPRIKLLIEPIAETAFHAVHFPKMPFARRQTASCSDHRSLRGFAAKRLFSEKKGEIVRNIERTAAA